MRSHTLLSTQIKIMLQSLHLYLLLQFKIYEIICQSLQGHQEKLVLNSFLLVITVPIFLLCQQN